MIREAGPDEEPALRRLQRHLAEPSPELLSYALGGPPPVLVSGDPAAGYLLLLLGEEAYVAELVVAPERRREGLATALLEAAAERAREAGCGSIRLTVRPDNGAALECYRSVGFAVAERLPEFYGDDPALVMRRRP